ncbi:MAG: hypothetical protein ACJ74H_03685 [Thermoanaerobaculia bacterium]
MKDRLFAIRLLFLLLVLPVTRAFATSFIMPTDDEMIARSGRIVVGTVQSSYVRERDGSIETVYDLRVERSLKGETAVRGASLQIVSPGGFLDGRGVLVHSAAHFSAGDKVLLFLIRHRGEWTPLDFTLGKFRFAVSNKGERLLTRDLEDVVAWERDGAVHEEKVRREELFLRFIQERVAGGRTEADTDYLVDASSVVLSPVPQSRLTRLRSEDTYTPGSYTSVLTGCCPTEGPHPSRWDTFPSAVLYHKKNDTDIVGALDGGVSTIQGALAAWTNDCGSNVNLQYGGTTTTASQDFDSVHVVEFNDPQNRIAGTFPETSSTVALTFISYTDIHSALSDTWWSITDADIVFQNGYTAASASFNTAMTHEVGHAIGWRHSNAPPSNAGAQTITCNPATEECTTTNTAVMFWQAGTTFGFTLQPWDIHAVRAVYPSTCITVLAPTNVVAAATTDTSVTVSWTAAAGATGYKVYRSSDNITFTLAGSPSASPFVDTVSSNTAYMYKVTSTDGVTESGFSNADFATAINFTDSTLVASSTAVKSDHFTQMRTAVNALRTLNGGQSAFSFTDPTLDNTMNVKAVHMNELRTQLNNVRTALGFSALTFTDTVTATSTPIRKVHVDELRNGVL